MCPLHPFQRGPWADPLEQGAEGSSSCSQEPSPSQGVTSHCSQLTTPVCRTQPLSLSSPRRTSQMYCKSRYSQSGVIIRELLTGITFPLTRTHKEPEPYFISIKNPTRGQLIQSPGVSSRNRILSAALHSSAFCHTLEILRHSAPRGWVSWTRSPGEEENPIPTGVPWSTGPPDLNGASTGTAPSQASPHVPTVARQGFLLRTEDPHSQGRPARWRHRALATSLSQNWPQAIILRCPSSEDTALPEFGEKLRSAVGDAKKTFHCKMQLDELRC